MADIRIYIEQIQKAVYGEEVRASIVNALNKVNDDNNSYQTIKTEVLGAKDIIVNAVNEYKNSIAVGETARGNLEKSTSNAVTAKSLLDDAITSAGSSKTALDESVRTSDSSKTALDESVKLANTAKTNADSSKTALDESVKLANTALSDVNLAINSANTSKKNLDDSVATADTAKTNIDNSTSAANTSKKNLDDSVKTANTTKTALDDSVKTANTTKTALDDSITNAQNEKKNLDAASGTVADSVKTAIQTKATLDDSVATADTAKTSLNDVITLGNTSKKNLDDSVKTAIQTKENVDQTIKNTEAAQTNLVKVTGDANTAKTNLDNSVNSANSVFQSLDSENIAAESNIAELRSENFNSQEILAGVADLRAYLGLTDDDIVGVQVDYKNKTFKRIAGAVNLTAGTDFDKFSMFGGRRRCNVADDGTIVAWFGDPDYKEDGTMGQVMIYQPKFYYLVCPVVYDPIETGIGYHLRKANYYVSEKPRAGFRLHPAFQDANGNEIDYFLTSAYEGNIYDTSASAYLLQDEQVADFTATTGDKFSSIAGARPASGHTQNLTRPNVEQLAQNRGVNWHGDLIKQVSAEQLLMIIELGVMNTQTAIGQGVTQLQWAIGADTTSSYAAATGSTATIGNGTGRAAKTTTYEGGVAKEETVDGKTSICWRGKENFWGNIWKFVYGINIWGNGKMAGGEPYICNDFNFAENKKDMNYVGAGFTATPKTGYISAMGYSTTCDWLFIASECTGNSSLPVGDYTYVTENLNAYRIAFIGGSWVDWGGAGAFTWGLDSGVGGRRRHVGGRLVFIPTKGSATYDAAIASWKKQMGIVV